MPGYSTFPAFALAAERDRVASKINGNLSLRTNDSESFLVSGQPASFKVTKETADSDAQLAAQMWLKHPAYKMTLASSRKDADVNNDGLIDQQEFRDLLQSTGYHGGNSDALFAKIDADGDGKLTEAEIKFLSQGKVWRTAHGRHPLPLPQIMTEES